MYSSRKVLQVAAFVLAITVAIAGCVQPGSDESGSLQLTVDPDRSLTRSITPSGSMVATHFDITVSSVGQGVVLTETDFAGGTILFEGVQPDTYSINVIGKNAAGGTAIGEGTTSDVVVGRGAIVPVTVTVVEYVGTGTLDLDLWWQPDVIVTPDIQATIAYGVDPAAPMVWSITDANGGSYPGTPGAEFTDATLQNGWYSIVTQIFDNGNLSTGFATLARVAKDMTSYGEIQLTANAASGTLDLLIETDFYEELPITSSYAAGVHELPEGAAPVNITVDTDGGETALFTWYVNGEAVQAESVASSSYTFDPSSAIAGDMNRLDLIAITSDGRMANSLTWEFTVLEGQNFLTIVSYSNNNRQHTIEVVRVSDMGVAASTSYVATATTTPWITPDLPADDYYILLDSQSGINDEAYGNYQIITVPVEAGSVFDFGVVD